VSFPRKQKSFLPLSKRFVTFTNFWKITPATIACRQTLLEQTRSLFIIWFNVGLN
jgi:hypothetical protein